MSEKSNEKKRDAIYEKNFNSCSARDCTGLIPSAITDEAQIEAYEEIYPFLTPPLEHNAENNNAPL